MIQTKQNKIIQNKNKTNQNKTTTATKSCNARSKFEAKILLKYASIIIVLCVYFGCWLVTGSNKFIHILFHYLKPFFFNFNLLLFCDKTI